MIFIVLSQADMSAHICFMEIILNWLSGQQNFTVGTILYKTFGTDDAFKEQLSEGETEENKKRLAQELQKIVDPPPEVAFPEHQHFGNDEVLSGNLQSDPGEIGNQNPEVRQPIKVEIPKDPIKLAMLMHNLKKSIRVNRKLMNEHPDNPKYAQLYNQYKEKHKFVTGTDYKEK